MTKEEKKEIGFLCEWCITIQKFPVEGEADYTLVEEIQFRESIKTNHNLSGWRAAVRDMCEAAESMSPENMEKLNAILREKFGMDLTTMKNA